MLKERGLLHLSTGDLLRAAVKEGTPLGLEAKRYMDAGDLVPDAVVIGMIQEALAGRTDDFMLDGFPRTRPQAQALAEALQKAEIALDAVVLIEVPDELIVLIDIVALLAIVTVAWMLISAFRRGRRR